MSHPSLNYSQRRVIRSKGRKNHESGDSCTWSYKAETESITAGLGILGGFRTGREMVIRSYLVDLQVEIKGPGRERWD